MILGILLLLGGGAFLVLAYRRLRAARDPNWVRAEATRLRIGPMPGQDEPRLALWRGDRLAFGPVPVAWDPPEGMAALPAPATGSGTYRVMGAVDLAGDDAFGTGDPRLAQTLRGALGTGALLLAPEGGDRPVLLHGTGRNAGGSAAGFGIKQAQLDALLAALGDPAGLRVEVVRRRVQRSGWGGAQGQRRRRRQ